MLARNARKGSVKDLFCRPSKFSHREIILDDDGDSGSISETAVQTQGAGSGAMALSNVIEYTNNGETPFVHALRVVGREPILIVGDFDGPSKVWGYRREEKRGLKRAELASMLDLSLHTDLFYPTRIGNSVTRDTCPDVTFARTFSMQSG
ncbi:hypothetical protein HPB51_010361 [Rhipicephalus microplus]|uniref:Uncharacterized protein n=1 Tax=Rhipicephalus microplus TaxID=6941 RepID=A0A9J6E0G9_RHIMP|nr:hypothetical protein HPB51_010361 [Rhipicephalus microplus]